MLFDERVSGRTSLTGLALAAVMAAVTIPSLSWSDEADDAVDEDQQAQREEEELQATADALQAQIDALEAEREALEAQRELLADDGESLAALERILVESGVHELQIETDVDADVNVNVDVDTDHEERVIIAHAAGDEAGEDEGDDDVQVIRLKDGATELRIRQLDDGTLHIEAIGRGENRESRDVFRLRLDGRGAHAPRRRGADVRQRIEERIIARQPAHAFELKAEIPAEAQQALDEAMKAASGAEAVRIKSLYARDQALAIQKELAAKQEQLNKQIEYSSDAEKAFLTKQAKLIEQSVRASQDALKQQIAEIAAAQGEDAARAAQKDLIATQEKLRGQIQQKVRASQEAAHKQAEQVEAETRKRAKVEADARPQRRPQRTDVELAEINVQEKAILLEGAREEADRSPDDAPLARQVKLAELALRRAELELRRLTEVVY